MLIFDCDGVLVDSEVLVTDVHVRALRRLGLNISHAQLVERFLGVTDHSMYAALEVELGRPLPEDYDQQVSEEVYRRSARELRAVTGAAAAIRRIRGPVCVASSSSREMLDYKLSVTGLVRLFGAAIFSADAVARGKPAPDIFQYAAREMGIAAAECLVVEDSENGVKAAVAAGMEVIGFTGGSHLSRSHGACLIDVGARAVAEDFAALMQLAPERFRQARQKAHASAIAAVRRAHQRHGGDGALYIVLKRGAQDTSAGHHMVGPGAIAMFAQPEIDSALAMPGAVDFPPSFSRTASSIRSPIA